jgi:diguanylate cyclase (GGDEF)-like protein/PAS domain S-box-containing protein
VAKRRREHYEKVTRTGRPVHFEDERAGRKFDISAYPVFDDGGRVARIAIFAQDITERKRMEKALRESENKFRDLAEKSSVGIYLIQDGIFRYVNSKFAEIHGYTIEEMLGKRGPKDTTFREDWPKVKKGLHPKMSGETEAATLDIRIVRHDGETRHAEIHTSPTIYKGKPALVGTLLDVTERKAMEERLRTMSIVDDLTGLYNRRGFFTLAQRQLKLAERTREKLLLFFIDLDRMKWINDTLGHQEGDAALGTVTSILRRAFRESDIIGRVGGDEFAILVIDAKHTTRDVLIRRLQDSLDKSNRMKPRRYSLALSVGVAYYDPKSPSTLDDLMAAADRLMYADKRNKKHRK